MAKMSGWGSERPEKRPVYKSVLDLSKSEQLNMLLQELHVCDSTGHLVTALRGIMQMEQLIAILTGEGGKKVDRIPVPQDFHHVVHEFRKHLREQIERVDVLLAMMEESDN